MTSLPERLRSYAKRPNSFPDGLLLEAADELDRQAVRIQRLEFYLGHIRGKAGHALSPPEDEAPPDQADAPIEKLRAYVEDEVIVSPEVDAARWYAAPDKPRIEFDEIDAPVTRSELSRALAVMGAAILRPDAAFGMTEPK